MFSCLQSKVSLELLSALITFKWCKSSHIDSLSQAVEESIQQSQAPVAHAAMGADQLIKDKGKKLRPEQNQNLQTKNVDLKNRYDDLASGVKQKKNDLEQTINRVKADKEQKVSLGIKISNWDWGLR